MHKHLKVQYLYRPDKQPRDLDTFINGCIHAASARRMNDPTEYKALDRSDENWRGSRIDSIATDNKVIAESNHTHPGDLFRCFAFTCFSRSYSNPLLWSHYADQHRGFAIGYIADHPSLKERWYEVTYEDVLPSMNFHGGQFPVAAITTKATCWAYEQESRILYANEGLKEIPANAATELLLGAAMDDARANEITNLVEQAGIKVNIARMQSLDDAYGVQPMWIDGYPKYDAEQTED